MIYIAPIVSLGFIEGGSEIIINGKQNAWLKARGIVTQNIIKFSRDLGLPRIQTPAC